MERLTERLENGVINVKYASQHETAIHRLAAIEDILGDDYDLDCLREALERQSEYEAFMKDWEVLAEIAGAVRKAGAKRAAELVEADRDGRCVVLPVKRGDVVYCILERLDETTGKRYKVVTQKEVTFMQSLPDLFECQGFVYTFDEFGKTVFRTKEAAQEELERMERNG